MKKYKIRYSNYTNNDNLALILVDGKEDVCPITVNLNENLLPNFGYLDINNLPKQILTMLLDNKIYEHTFQIKQSGFVEYPLVMFNFDKINEFNKRKEMKD